MKVAICISGHLRTFRQTHQSLKKHLLSRYDCDTFIHTWDVLGSPRKEDAANSSELTDIKEVDETYKPIAFSVQSQLDFTPAIQHQCFSTARTPPQNVISKWFSSKQAFDLIATWHRGYDVVVSLRPDMFFHEDVMLVVDNDHVHIPGNIKVPDDTLHDYFAFGPMHLMEKYFDACQDFDVICSQLRKFRPEMILTEHIKRQNIPIKFCNIEYSMIRPNGEIRRA